MPRSKNKRNVEECHEAVGDVDGGEDKGKGECEETTNPKTCSASGPCSTLQEEEDTNASSTKDSTEPAKKKPRKNPTKTDQKEKDNGVDKDQDKAKDNEKEKGKESTTQISKNRFVNNAGEFEFTIDGHKHVMRPKLFKSGSVGWHYSGVVKLTVDENPLSTQCTVSAVVTKSKQWPESCGDPSKECAKHNESDDEQEQQDDDYDPEKEEEYQEDKERVVDENEEEDEDEEEDGESESDDDSTIKMKRSDFLSKAQNIGIGGFEKEITLKPKKFKTSSVGWYSSSKPHKLFDDVNLPLQVTVTFTVLRSKTWDE